MVLKDFFSFKISREFIVLMFFMVATFFFFLYEIEQMGVAQLHSEVLDLDNKIKAAKIENRQLKSEIDDLKSDVGVVKMARERLRLVFPGEIIIKAVTSEEVRIQKLRNLNAVTRKSVMKQIKREEVVKDEQPSQPASEDETGGEEVEADVPDQSASSPDDVDGIKIEDDTVE